MSTWRKRVAQLPPWCIPSPTIGPEILIFGLPLGLKAILLIGTLLSLLAAASIYALWRSRKTLNYVLAATFLANIPFVSYWNLKLLGAASAFSD